MWRKILCFFGQHSWAAPTELGEEPDPELVAADPVGYFWEFAVPTCRHCGTKLPPRGP